MNPSRDQIFLYHILDAIKQIDIYLKKVSVEQFKENRLLIDGVVRELEIIGEAVNNISDELKDKYSKAPWHKVVGMRNRLIHGYFEVDLDIVWTTCKKELKELKQHIAEIK